MQNFEIITLTRGQPNSRMIAGVKVRIGENEIQLKARRSRADGTPFLAPTLSSYALEQEIVAEVMRRLQTRNL